MSNKIIDEVVRIINIQMMDVQTIVVIQKPWDLLQILVEWMLCYYSTSTPLMISETKDVTVN